VTEHRKRPRDPNQLGKLIVETTLIVHKNLAIVMTYAFSVRALQEFRDRLPGDWKHLDRAIFELPERRSRRACVELAVMLRALDDVQDITRFFQADFGILVKEDGSSEPLPYREVFNKLIHAKRIDWTFDDPKDPYILCVAPADQTKKFGWTKAAIKVTVLAEACGRLVS
jgi:hypothetical protein